MVKFFGKTRDRKHSSNCAYLRKFHKADSIKLGLERCINFLQKIWGKDTKVGTLKSGSENGEYCSVTEG